MRKLASLVALLLLSLLLFVAVFSTVHRPLTIGGVAQDMQGRAAYAATLPSRRLIIWAGSNGRYSHRCDAMAAPLQRPCVNLSLAMGIGLDYQMMEYEPLLRAGDLVYMPLEYEQYRIERNEMEGGAENPALVRDRRELLWQQGPRRIAAAYGYFDLPYLVHGLLEMGLAGTGVRPRSAGTEAATPQGDTRGHTAAAASHYARYVARMRLDARPLPADSHALRVLDGFLARASARGVRVVGGLPTLPDTVAADPDDSGRLRALFERHGHHWLELPNRSRYPLSCFYDTLYHLHEDANCGTRRQWARRSPRWRTGRPTVAGHDT